MRLKLLWTTNFMNGVQNSNSNWIKSFEQKLFCQVVIEQGEILKSFTFICIDYEGYEAMEPDYIIQRSKFRIHPIVVTSNFWGNRSLDGCGGQGVEFNYTSWTSSPQDAANLAVRLNINTFLMSFVHVEKRRKDVSYWECSTSTQNSHLKWVSNFKLIATCA